MKEFVALRECLECRCQLCGGVVQRASRASSRWIHAAGDKAHEAIPMEHPDER